MLRCVARVETWRFCPRCAAELTHERERVDCLSCGFVAHSNCEPTACALVVDGDGRLLLVRRAHDPYGRTWDLPGGFLEENEHPLAALRRELLEETGLEVEPLEFVGAMLDRYGDGHDAATTLNLYWTAEVVGGDPRAGDDAAELRWFPRDHLPPDDEIGFPNVRQVLRAWKGRSLGEAD
jgi:ADP-ribose pyrophosphatase YjhB (NUDIX family)